MLDMTLLLRMTTPLRKSLGIQISQGQVYCRYGYRFSCLNGRLMDLKHLFKCISHCMSIHSWGKGKTRKRKNGNGKAEKRVKGGKAEKRLKGGKAEKRVKGGKKGKRRKKE